MDTDRIKEKLDPFAAVKRMAAEGIDFSAFCRDDNSFWDGRWTMDLGSGATLLLVKCKQDSGWVAVIKRLGEPAGSDGFQKTPEKALAESLKEADRIFGGL